MKGEKCVIKEDTTTYKESDMNDLCHQSQRSKSPGITLSRDILTSNRSSHLQNDVKHHPKHFHIILFFWTEIDATNTVMERYVLKQFGKLAQARSFIRWISEKPLSIHPRIQYVITSTQIIFQRLWWKITDELLHSKRMITFLHDAV